MKKIKLEVMEKEMTTNSIGEPIVSFEKTGESLWSDYVLPVGHQSTLSNIKAWGFDPSKALETRTRGDLRENTFVLVDASIFHINKVLVYPRFRHAFLEEVSEDG